jgi:hypothetical protein
MGLSLLGDVLLSDASAGIKDDLRGTVQPRGEQYRATRSEVHAERELHHTRREDASYAIERRTQLTIELKDWVGIQRVMQFEARLEAYATAPEIAGKGEAQLIDSTFAKDRIRLEHGYVRASRRSRRERPPRRRHDFRRAD